MRAYDWTSRLLGRRPKRHSRRRPKRIAESLTPRLTITRLEERRVLNADAAPVEVLVVDAGDAAGDGQADTFQIEHDADQIRILVNGQETHSGSAEGLSAIRVNGSSDNDLLVADLLAGVQLTFAGGDGADLLQVQSGAEQSEVDYDLGSTGDGQLEAASADGVAKILFEDVEGVSDNLQAADRSFTLIDSGVGVTLSDGGEGVTRLTLAHDASADGGLTVDFQEPADSLLVDTSQQAGAADEVLVTGIGAGFDADLRIEGSSDDSLTLDSAVDLGSGSLVASTGSVVLGGDLTTNAGGVEVAAGSSLNVAADATIDAGGGRVRLTAADIQIDGRIESAGGEVLADSGADGTTVVSGVIDVSDLAAGGRGGVVHLLGAQVGVAPGAVVDASGDVAGGVILAGGALAGANPLIRNANVTFVGEGAELRADAARSGAGGRIIVWADDTTRFYGHASARGGQLGGDGGFAEISGRRSLTFDGTVDLLAPAGEVGTLLLDPESLTISAAADSNVTAVSPFTPAAAGPANLDVTTLLTALAAANVVVQTTDLGTADAIDPGDLTVATAIDYDGVGTRTLTLIANRDVVINAAIFDSDNSTADSLTIVVTADSDASDLGTGAGDVLINAAIDTGGGDFTSSGTNFVSVVAGTITTGGGNVDLDFAGNITIGGAVATGGGNFDSTTTPINATTAVNANVSTSGGAVTFANVGAGVLNIAATIDTDGGAFTATAGLQSINSDSGGTGSIDTSGAADTAGGSVDITVAVAGGAILGAIDTSGGADADASGANNAGTITVDVVGGISAFGAITAQGGADAGLDAAGAAGGAVSFTAGAAVNINAAVNTSGGAGSVAGVGGSFTSTGGGNFSSIGAGTITTGGGLVLLDHDATPSNVTISGAIATGGGAFTSNGANFDNNATISTVDTVAPIGVGGAVTLNHTGTVDIDNSVTTGGGAFTANTPNTAFDSSGQTIDTSGGDNQNGGDVTVVSSGMVTAGAITTDGGADADASGANNAGAVSLTGSTVVTSGAINALGGDDNGLDAPGGAGGDVTLAATTTVDVNAAVNTSGGAGSAAGTGGNFVSNGGGAFTSNAAGTITTGGGLVDLNHTGGDVTIGGTVTTGGGTFNSDGANFDNNAAITTSGADITLIHTGTVAIDSSLNAGAGVVRVVAGGAVTQGGGAIIASALGVRQEGAAGAITLNQTNNVDTFAALNNGAGGAVTFDNDGLATLTIGTVTAAAGFLQTDGITAAGGAVSVSNADGGNAGDVLVNTAVATGGGDFTSAGAAFTNNAPGTIATAGGNVDLQHTGNVVLNAAVTTGGGDLTSAGLAFTNNVALATAGGSIDINNTGAVNIDAAVTTLGGSFAADGPNASFDSSGFVISTAGGAAAAGGDITINSTGTVTAGALTSVGGANPAVAGTGGMGGNISVTGDTLALTSITTTGGAAPGAGGTGGASGDVSLTSTQTLTVAIAIDTSGGVGAGANGEGGNVAVASTTADVIVNATVTTGGGAFTSTGTNFDNNTAINTVDAGAPLGAGGAVTLNHTGTVDIDGAVTTGGGAFTANTPNASFDSSGFTISTAGVLAGGTGGAITVVSNGAVSTGTLTSAGAANPVLLGVGGVGGNISLTGDTLTLGAITTSGGAAPLGTGGASGDLTLQANAAIIVGAPIDTSGGVGGVANGEGGNVGLTSTNDDVTLNATVTTGGGTFTSAGVNFDNNAAINTVDAGVPLGAGGAVTLNHTGTVDVDAAITTGGGAFVANTPNTAFDSSGFTISTAGVQAGGIGGAITIDSTGAVAAGALTSTGAADPAAAGTGGVGGNVTITGDSLALTSITTTGGAAPGAGGTGGVSGDVSLTSTQTLTVAIAIDTAGGVGAAANGEGGNVAVASTAADVIVNALVTTGGGTFTSTGTNFDNNAAINTVDASAPIGAGGAVTLNHTGTVDVDATVTTGGGAVTSSGTTFQNSAAITTAGGNALLNHSSTVALNADLNAAAGDVRVIAGADVTQALATAVTANLLGVRQEGAVGAVTLTNNNNNVNTFAALNNDTDNSISFNDTDGVIIGTVAASGPFAAIAGVTVTDGTANLVAGAIDAELDDATADVIAATINLTATGAAGVGGIGDGGASGQILDVSATTEFNATTIPANTNILIDSIGTLPIGQISAGLVAGIGTGTVTLDGTAALTDADADDGVGSAVDIIASAAILQATQGIGAAGAVIETTLSTLQAVNTTAGDIAIEETDGLVVDGLTIVGLGVQTQGGGGSISIDANTGGLTVAAAVTADTSGDILLNADTGLVFAAAAVGSGTGNVAVVGDAVTQAVAGTISTGGAGTIGITADAGNIFMFSGANTTAAAGAATLAAQQSVFLSTVTSSGGIGVTATTGAIVDNLAGEVGANLQNSTVTLVAATGIGSGTGDLDEDADIDLSIGGAEFNASNTTSGAIQVFSDGDIALGAVMNAGDTLLGDVVLDASGAITEATSDAAADIVTSDAVLRSATGVGAAGDAIETTIARVEVAGGAGGVFLTDTDALEIGDASVVLAGATAGATATLDIEIATATDDLLATQPVTSTAQSVTLTGADDAMINAAVTGAMNAAVDATAGNLTSSAAGAITATDESVTLNSGANTILDGAVLGDENVTATTGADFTSNATVTATNQSVDVDAGVNANLNAAVAGGINVSVDATAGSLATGAAGTLTATADSVTLNAGVNTAIGAAVLAGEDVVSTTGVNLTVGGTVTAGSTDVAAGNGVDLEAGNTAAINANVAAASSIVRIAAAAPSVGAVSLGGGVFVTAAGGSITQQILVAVTGRFEALDGSANETIVPISAGDTATISVDIFEPGIGGTPFDIEIDFRESAGDILPPVLFPGAIAPVDAAIADDNTRVVSDTIQSQPPAVPPFTFDHTFLTNPDSNESPFIFVVAQINQFAPDPMSGVETIDIELGDAETPGATIDIEAFPQAGLLGENLTGSAATAFANFFSADDSFTQLGIQVVIAIEVLEFALPIPVLPEALPFVEAPAPVAPTIIPVVQTVTPTITPTFEPVAASVATTAELRYYELRIVSFDQDGRLIETPEDRINLSDPELEAIAPFNPSKLPSLFRLLPGDRYRIYLIEDGAERLMIDFVIERVGDEGSPIELPEEIETETSGEAPSTDLDTAPEAVEAAPPTGGGLRLGDKGPEPVAPALAKRSFAEEVGRASFVSSGGLLFGAALLSPLAGGQRADRADRRMAEFANRRRFGS